MLIDTKASEREKGRAEHIAISFNVAFPNNGLALEFIKYLRWLLENGNKNEETEGLIFPLNLFWKGQREFMGTAESRAELAHFTITGISMY